MKVALVLLFVALAVSFEATEKFKGITEHSISSKGLDLIAKFEPFSSTFAKTVSGDKFIGYGYLCKTHNDCEKVSSPVTTATAKELLKSDLAPYESCVKSAIKADLTTNQYDALVSFAYSMGCTKFTDSAVVVAVNAEDYDGAKRQLLQYVQANGMILRGLVTRRNYEAALFGQGYNDLNRD